MYTYRQWHISDLMMVGLTRYVEAGIRPGSFLTALLCNDLADACDWADAENLANIQAYAAWLRYEAPGTCWGSREKMEAWIASHKKVRTPDAQPKETTMKNEYGFKFAIGQQVVHVLDPAKSAKLDSAKQHPVKLLIISRKFEECAGGVQRAYSCRVVKHMPVFGGPYSDNLVVFHELELRETPADA